VDCCGSPNARARARVVDALRALLTSRHLDSARRVRVLAPDSEVLFFTMNRSGQSIAEPASTLVLLLAGPVGIVALLGLGLLALGDLLHQAMSAERENRMLEMLLGLVSADALLAGKLAGLAAVGLLQIGCYVVGFGIAAVSGFTAGQVGIGFLAAATACFLTGYVVIASVMGAVGAVSRTPQEGSQLSSLLVTALIVPLLVSPWVLADSGQWLATALSWFPITSPVALLLRLSADRIGVFEFVAALTLDWCVAALVLRVAARAIRSVAIGSSGGLFRWPGSLPHETGGR
jgi:ABC-2 type transport system permease protein